MSDQTQSRPVDDPLLARRAHIYKLAATGKRIGYGIIGLACAVFVIGWITSFQGWMIPFTAICFGLSALILCPAIIAAYGVDAANKDEGLPSYGRSRH